ncbi:hypothetical protein ABK040_000041 [Willaertia magna]
MSQNNDRYISMKLVYGEEFFEFVRNSKVLVVGAGGIGCELLKNLVLCGFENIEIIDLDTIDVSNLNRQFLFRQRHVGESKSKIAKETALTFNPYCNIVSHHGNIKHSNFGLDFFRQFKIVINALDNVDARRHVNRMCLAANIPMLDGGTAGYLGQVKTYVKGFTECYECGAKVTEKTYAVCTIRSNPSKMIHCVVWAKLLFDRLFGKIDDANAISNFEEILKDKEGFEKKVFEKVFQHDIEELRNLKNKEVWNSGKPPEPLTEEYLNKVKENHKETTKVGVKDQKVWTADECVERLFSSLKRLRERRENSNEPLSFDKDDEDALDLVTSAANLRAYNFHIENKSRFDVKAMAGNIVPAIATTNAITAGLLVSESMKVLKSIYEHKDEKVNHAKDCFQVDCLRFPSSKNRKPCLIFPVKLGQPNKNCFVCSSNSIFINLNCDKMTLGYFVEEILMKQFALKEPMISVEDAIIYECGGELMEDELESFNNLLKKPLKDIKIVDGSELIVEDFSQDISWKVTIRHKGSETPVEEYDIDNGKIEEAKKSQEETNGIIQTGITSAPPSTSVLLENNNAVDKEIVIGDDDELVCVTDNLEKQRKREEKRLENKRKREVTENNLSSDDNPTKDVKLGEDEVVVLDE